MEPAFVAFRRAPRPKSFFPGKQLLVILVGQKHIRPADRGNRNAIDFVSERARMSVDQRHRMISAVNNSLDLQRIKSFCHFRHFRWRLRRFRRRRL